MFLEFESDYFWWALLVGVPHAIPHGIDDVLFDQRVILDHRIDTWQRIGGRSVENGRCALRMQLCRCSLGFVHRRLETCGVPREFQNETVEVVQLRLPKPYTSGLFHAV